MVGGEDNPGSYADKEISSSSFEDVPSRVDAAGVITCLRPIKESQADIFWKKYSFPPTVRVSLSSSGASFCGLYGGRPRGGEFHLLVGGSHK